MSCTIFPTYSYDDAAAAIDLLERAFGFRRGEVHTDDEGRVAHAEIWLGESAIMLGTTGRGEAPKTGNGASYVVVEDADAHHARAVEAGAEIAMALRSTDYGSRDYAARDLEGNLWYFGTYAPTTPGAPQAAGGAPSSHQGAAR
jgi:uncharacterized glyoxalase superfamily protein PhnB